MTILKFTTIALGAALAISVDAPHSLASHASDLEPARIASILCSAFGSADIATSLDRLQTPSLVALEVQKRPAGSYGDSVRVEHVWRSDRGDSELSWTYVERTRDTFDSSRRPLGTAGQRSLLTLSFRERGAGWFQNAAAARSWLSTFGFLTETDPTEPTFLRAYHPDSASKPDMFFSRVAPKPTFGFRVAVDIQYDMVEVQWNIESQKTGMAFCKQ